MQGQRKLKLQKHVQRSLYLFRNAKRLKKSKAAENQYLPKGCSKGYRREVCTLSNSTEPGSLIHLRWPVQVCTFGLSWQFQPGSTKLDWKPPLECGFREMPSTGTKVNAAAGGGRVCAVGFVGCTLLPTAV